MIVNGLTNRAIWGLNGGIMTDIYEHMVMPVDFNFDRASIGQDDSILNNYGREGWELVSAVPVTEKGTTCQILYCLKRLKGKG